MVIAKSEKCSLVSRQLEDFDWFWYWLNNGDWRDTDAPWEITLPEEKENIKNAFIKGIIKENFGIKTRVWIVTNEMKIGSLNAYGFNKEKKSVKIGIGIYKPEYRGLRIAQSALNLWIKYYFENFDITRIELETYNFNIPMIKTAEKIGFILGKIQNNIREWNNNKIDKYYYYMEKEYK